MLDSTRTLWRIYNMTTTKCKRRKKPTKEQQILAYRYRCAYNHLFEQLPDWKKKVIIENDKDHRIVKEFAHEVAMLAESNREIPDLNND